MVISAPFSFAQKKMVKKKAVAQEKFL